MTILGLGPYIGDFPNELLTFRPYIKWLTEVIDYDGVYINTHVNRSFLYDFIPEENFIPVYEVFSRNEKGQTGYIHKDLHQKDFNLLVRKFRDKISKIEKCNKKDIEIHHLNYVKSTPHYSIFNKVFDKINKPININIPEEHKNRLIFIPSRTETLNRSAYIYDYLKKNHDCLVVGDVDTWFSNDNVVLSNIDYFENGWKYIVSYIYESKGVICPSSYWTALCNLQNKPVFSWGPNPSRFREEGIYNFKNRDSSIIPADADTSPTIIIKSIEDFLRGIK